MGNKKERTYTKQTYKRSTQKFYVKSDDKALRKAFLADIAVKGIALAFYPFYLAISGTGKIIKKLKHSIKTPNKVTFKKKMKPVTFDLSSVKRHIQKGQKWTQETFNKGIHIVETRFPKPFNNKWVVTGISALAIVGIVGVTSLSAVVNRQVDVVEPFALHHVNVANVDVTEDAVAAQSTLEKVSLPEVGVKSFAVVRAYQLIVNGKVIANFKTENEANRVLAALKAEFENPENAVIEDLYFYEEVSIEEGTIDIIDFVSHDSVDEALEFIRKGTKQEKTHVVQKGENYWVIAAYYDVSPYDLEAANPDIKPEQLQIGTEISLVVPQPIITVCTVETATYSDKIAFDVEYEPTATLYKGESRTKVNGVYGEKVITAEVVKQNGREIMRTILTEEVVSEPQTRVVYQGTTDPPPRMGTGTFIRPMAGVISDEFGTWRFGARHRGIDISAPIGTIVKAADGGVVTTASYNSSYGHYVVIDHGSNITTLYAHNSSIAVKRGDQVYQGQTIAYSGNTGFSTGPHLHFEVRVNDVPQNPRNYVKF